MCVMSGISAMRKAFLIATTSAGSGCGTSCKQTRRKTNPYSIPSIFVRGCRSSLVHFDSSIKCKGRKNTVCKSANQRGQSVYLAGREAIQTALRGRASCRELRKHTKAVARWSPRGLVSVPVIDVGNHAIRSQKSLQGEMECESCNVDVERGQAE